MNQGRDAEDDVSADIRHRCFYHTPAVLQTPVALEGLPGTVGHLPVSRASDSEDVQRFTVGHENKLRVNEKNAVTPGMRARHQPPQGIMLNRHSLLRREEPKDTRDLRERTLPGHKSSGRKTVRQISYCLVGFENNYC